MLKCHTVGLYADEEEIGMKLGDLIVQVDERNANGSATDLLGVAIEKRFMPSVANVIGTDLSKYKLVTKDRFACNPMHVGRDEKLPIARFDGDGTAIVSPAYFTFEVKNAAVLPRYLELWFSRPEFDRRCWFATDASVRGGLSWDAMCEIPIELPSIDKQQSIIDAFNAVNRRIATLQQLNDKLAASADTILLERYLAKDSDDGNSFHLGDLISFSNGKARPKASGNIPVYGGNGVMDRVNEHNAQNVVVIGRVGAYCGSVYLEEDVCWVSDNAIQARSRISDAEYFDYVLLKHLDLYSHHVGTGQQLLTQGILSNIECPPTSKSNIDEINSLLCPLLQAIRIHEKECERLDTLRITLLTQLGQSS